MLIILSLARTCCTLRRTRLHLVYRARYTYNDDRPVGRCSLCYWRVANYMMILRCTYIYLPTEDCDQCTTEETGIVTRAHTHTDRTTMTLILRQRPVTGSGGDGPNVWTFSPYSCPLITPRVHTFAVQQGRRRLRMISEFSFWKFFNIFLSNIILPPRKTIYS